MEDFVVVRGASRFVSEEPGLTSRHSFSFGRHYDPANVGFGLLVLNNDDVVQPGFGYETHPHRDVEIVTWVLDGALAHRDSTGAGGVIYPGLAQRLSAGRGVQHSEFNDAPEPYEDVTSGDGDGARRSWGRDRDRRGWPRLRLRATEPSDDGEGRRRARSTGRAARGGRRAVPEAPLRFVQMWVPPDESGAEPAYEQCDVSTAVASGRLVTVASGMHRYRDVAAIRLGQRAAAMHVAQLTAGVSATLPSAPFVHVYVTRGTVDLEGIGRLDDGDAARITDEGGRQVHPVPGAEVIIWEMHADVHAAPPSSR